jgi:hypothetical protein
MFQELHRETTKPKYSKQYLKKSEDEGYTETINQKLALLFLLIKYGQQTNPFKQKVREC